MASVQGTAVRSEPPNYWSPGRVALATIVVAAVAAAFVVLYYLQAAIFCLFIGIILATALRRPVAWLERRGLQHVTAVVIVFGVLVVVLLVALGLGIPLLTGQALELRQALPGFYEQARERFVNSTTGLMHQFAMQLSPTLPWLTSASTDGHATAEFAPPRFDTWATSPSACSWSWRCSCWHSIGRCRRIARSRPCCCLCRSRAAMPPAS